MITGYRGYLFDASKLGSIVTLQQPEPADPEPPRDKVLRCLEKRRSAEELKLEEKAAFFHRQALVAARSLVSQEPENPEAHVLLAWVLDWRDQNRRETVASLEAALKLDAVHPMATAMLLRRRITRTLEATALRRVPGIDEEAIDVVRVLYERPLDAEEFTACETEMQRLGREVDQLLSTAHQRRDLGSFLHGIELRAAIHNGLVSASASNRRPPDATFEGFATEIHQQQVMSLFDLLEDSTLFDQAIELAGTNAEAVGTIVITRLGGWVIRNAMEDWEPSPKGNDRILRLATEMVQIARADDSPNAARAAETVCIINLMRTGLNQKPFQPDLLQRALQLDPLRHRTLGFLALVALSGEAPESDACAAAVMTLQLAALPTLQTRRLSSAGAAKIGDYDTALRLLDECDKEQPGDLMLLNQRIATLLHRDQSQASVTKAARLYDQITRDRIVTKTAHLEAGDRRIFLENFLRYLLLKGENEATAELIDTLTEAGVFGPDDAADIQKWLDNP
jgi:hypothetical protein